MEKVRYMVTFAHVVQAGSFVGAADKLSLAPSVVSKHISKLEAQMGVRLMNRSTRSLSLTEAGSAYYQHCARIVEELAQSEEAVASLQAEPQGHLRISASTSITNSILVPMLPGFLQQYPKVEIEIINSEHIIDLVEEGFDLALRITGTPAPQLVARRLFPVIFRIMGSADYLQRHGTPESLEDLDRHVCLSYPNAAGKQWILSLHGRRVEKPIHGSVQINSIEALRRLTLEGMGLALLPVSACIRDLQNGQLQCVLPAYRGFGEDSHLHVVYLQNRYGSPKLKVFVEHLVTYVRALELEHLDVAPA